MKLTKKHFKIFKEECNLFINKLGLTGYEIYYEFKELEDEEGASIQVNDEGRIATISLNINHNNNKDTLIEGLKNYAKHEILHLLLSRFSYYNYSRFVDKNSIKEAEEEIVIKLLKLL